MVGRAVVLIGLLLFVSSCSGGKQGQSSTTTTTTTTTQTSPAASPAAASPAAPAAASPSAAASFVTSPTLAPSPTAAPPTPTHSPAATRRPLQTATKRPATPLPPKKVAAATNFVHQRAGRERRNAVGAELRTLSRCEYGRRRWTGACRAEFAHAHDQASCNGERHLRIYDDEHAVERAGQFDPRSIRQHHGVCHEAQRLRAV